MASAFIALGMAGVFGLLFGGLVILARRVARLTRRRSSERPSALLDTLAAQHQQAQAVQHALQHERAAWPETERRVTERVMQAEAEALSGYGRRHTDRPGPPPPWHRQGASS